MNRLKNFLVRELMKTGRFKIIDIEHDSTSFEFWKRAVETEALTAKNNLATTLLLEYQRLISDGASGHLLYVPYLPHTNKPYILIYVELDVNTQEDVFIGSVVFYIQPDSGVLSFLSIYKSIVNKAETCTYPNTFSYMVIEELTNIGLQHKCFIVMTCMVIGKMKEYLPQYGFKMFNDNLSRFFHYKLINECSKSLTIITKAVGVCGAVFEHLPDDLKNNREVVIAATHNYARALKFTTDTIKNDKDLLLFLVSRNAAIIPFLPRSVMEDNNFIKSAISVNEDALALLTPQYF